MNSSHPRPVPVPANIEVEARLVGPFTARQCVILAITTALALAEGEALHSLVLRSPEVVVAAVAPVVFAGIVLALVKPGGVPLDRLIHAAVKYVRTGLRQVNAPQHLALPDGINRLAPVYRRIAELDGVGVVELDGQQAAVVIDVEPRCLQLADAGEARAVLMSISTVLTAQPGPFAVSTLTERVDLNERTDIAFETAQCLTTPQLADFANRQAHQLHDLTGGRDVWQRRHLITLRETGANAGARAAHRARATTQLLESCGINARILDAAELTALLAAAAAPERSVTPRQLAPPDRPVTARLEMMEQA